MSGVTITVDTKPVAAMLRQLAERMDKLAPVMAEIGDVVVNQTDEAFERGASPGGARWPRSGRVRVHGGQTLIDTGRLRNSITRRVASTSVEVGSNVVYAAIQQLGGRTAPHVIRPRRKKALAFGGRVFRSVNHPGSNIPARPFLPDDASLDWEEIRATIRRYLGL